MERNATPRSMPLDENPSRDIINYRRIVWRFARYSLSLSKKKKEEKEERKEEGNRDKETSKYYIFEIEKATLRASIQFRV